MFRLYWFDPLTPKASLRGMRLETIKLAPGNGVHMIAALPMRTNHQGLVTHLHYEYTLSCRAAHFSFYNKNRDARNLLIVPDAADDEQYIIRVDDDEVISSIGLPTLTFNVRTGDLDFHDATGHILSISTNGEPAPYVDVDFRL